MAIFSLNEVRTEQIKNIANNNFESWPESATHGYFGGGYDTPTTPTTIRICTIDRLDFFTETVSAPGNDLTQGRSSLAGVSNSNYGYFGGGRTASPPFFACTIDRLDFSNETVSAPGNNLPQAKEGLAAVFN